MPIYVERPRTIEARKVTADSAADVAAWCGGMVGPCGAVFYPIGQLFQAAPEGSYIVHEPGNVFRHQDGADFEAAWAEADES